MSILPAIMLAALIASSPISETTSPETGVSKSIPAPHIAEFFFPRTQITTLSLTYFRVTVGWVRMTRVLNPREMKARIEYESEVDIDVFVMSYSRSSKTVADFDDQGLVSFNVRILEDEANETRLTGKRNDTQRTIDISGIVENKPFNSKIALDSFETTSIENYPFATILTGKQIEWTMLNLEKGIIEKVRVSPKEQTDCPPDVTGPCISAYRVEPDGDGNFLYSADGQLVKGSGDDKRGGYSLRYIGSDSKGAPPVIEEREAGVSRFFNFIKKLGKPVESKETNSPTPQIPVEKTKSEDPKGVP